ncbi:MAG: nucleoside triphosphate pyrophosphohydrolase family protein [Flavobacteriales bacterium]|nr:nucleoside triphosphate pyrophosphohydrolase family protein [Flavobacteriales bacterium]
MSIVTPKMYEKQVFLLPEEFGDENGVHMKEYQRASQRTDKMPDGLEMPILGLFGEVGSLLSALKKKLRDTSAFTKYDQIILEELGDVLWYFTIIATRAKLDLSILAQKMLRDISDWDKVESHEFGQFGDIQHKNEIKVAKSEFSQRIVELASKVGDLINEYGEHKLEDNRDKLSAHLVEIFRALVLSAKAAEISLDAAAYGNLRKTYSRWPVEMKYPPLLDSEMPVDERLPRKLVIFIEEQKINNRTFVIQKCKGIIIGDRLTDNKLEKDDYRFHDVFHLAFIAHLGWSPVLRGLFKLKRKSNPEIDENEDGARASLIEEGVSTFIFSHGLDRELFNGIKHVDYDLLKSIQDLIKGYEVERCALWQWERAILDGFKVFRALKKYRKGFIVTDIEEHTIEFVKEEAYES